jgi:hypothetical protein
VCPGLVHRTVQCATGQCSVLQDRTTPNSPPSVFVGVLRYNSPDCPVHQQSNDSLAQWSTIKAEDSEEQCANSARMWQNRPNYSSLSA